MKFDLERSSRDMPGSARAAHFNNAGASALPQAWLVAQLPPLRRARVIERAGAADGGTTPDFSAFDVLLCELDETSGLPSRRSVSERAASRFTPASVST